MSSRVDRTPAPTRLNEVLPDWSTPTALMSSIRRRCETLGSAKDRKVFAWSISVHNSYVDGTSQSVRWRCVAWMLI